MMRETGLFFLLLLKILGWTLLFLLVFLLLLFLLVMFVPIRYRVHVQNERNIKERNPIKTMRLQVQVHWLFHLIRFSVSYGPTGVQSQILAAGIDLPKMAAWFKKKKETRIQSKIKSKTKIKQSRRQEEQSKTLSSVKEQDQDQNQDQEKVLAAEQLIKPESESLQDSNEITSEEILRQALDFDDFTDPIPPLNSATAKQHSHKKERKNKKNRRQAGPGFFTRLRSQYDKIRSQYHRLCSQYHKLRKEIKDETNRYAVNRIWTEFLKIIRSCRPKKLKADISFSLADPALTGQAVGVISLLPWIYRYPCGIVPDFTSEQLYLEGEIFAQGNIRVIVFALTTLRLLRDKKFMRVVRRLLGRDL